MFPDTKWATERYASGLMGQPLPDLYDNCRPETETTSPSTVNEGSLCPFEYTVKPPISPT